MLSWSSNWASVIHPFIGFIVGMMKSLSDEWGWAHFVVWSSLWLVNGYPWVLVWVGKSLLTEKGEERAKRRNRKIVEAGRHLRFDPRALAAKATKMETRKCATSSPNKGLLGIIPDIRTFLTSLKNQTTNHMGRFVFQIYDKRKRWRQFSFL